MPSRDGLCWSCDLYIDGVKAAYVMDGGYGGDVEFDWYRKDLEQPFIDYVKTLPTYTAYGMTLKPNGGTVVSELCDKADAEKQVKKWCKTKTVVKFKKDQNNPDAFTTFKSPFTPMFKAALIKKYGSDIVEFVNERFL